MKNIKIILLTSLILLNLILTTGCWNYREVDQLAIVAGVAIDKGTNGQYQVTAEIVQISGGRDSKKTSKVITMEGKSLFDAVRNGISVTGKRLYWSHAKIIIINKDIAKDGLINIIDWFNRDTEIRSDISILISEGTSAKEIFSGQGSTEDIKSYVLDNILKSQVSLSKAPRTDILRFDNDLKGQGISAIAPTVSLKQTDGKILPQIQGTAVFKEDKLVGFLNGEETRDLIFIRNEIKGGILVEEMQTRDGSTPVSLEIFKNKTKIMPVMNNENIEINLDIDTTVAIDELGGTENFIEDEGRTKLEQSAENTLNERIEALIYKVQKDYGTDIFGFGAKLREDKLQAWNSVESNWGEVFSDLRVNVSTRVHIKNSASLSEPPEKGD